MNKKEEILKVALSEFAKNGYENTSLEEIAKKCNITKPAIYYHFKSKKELYNEVFRAIFSGLKFNLGDNFEENLKSYIKTLNNFITSEIAKLLSKELSNEMKNLDEKTISIISIMPKTLKKILPDKVNVFFIQTIIISSLTTYKNVANIRAKLAPMLEENANFNIEEELFLMLKQYIKDKI